MTAYRFLRLRLSCGHTIIGMYPTEPLYKFDRQTRGARMVCPVCLAWQFIKAEPEPATMKEREELTREDNNVYQ